MRKQSKQMCDQLLEGNRAPVSFPGWPAIRRRDVMERVQSLPEGRIQRDVLPIVVPSAENLHFCGESGLELLGDEIQTEWTRCAPMGSTRPKPDYVAGLRRKAFSKEIFEQLRNYATPFRPFLFTPDICYPFLIAEAKTGDEGLAKADRQNIHSAGIAIRSIIELHWAAYGKEDTRVQQLYGQALVFTISHNHDAVHIYAHFAVLVDGSLDQLKFHRYQIALYSLNMLNGRDQDKPYTFVRNVYDYHAPQHLQRIVDAADRLRAKHKPRSHSPAPSKATGLSFAAPNVSLNETASQQDSQETHSQDNDIFPKPSESASASQMKEMVKLREQIDKLLEQLEQLRRESKEKELRTQEQLEQQRRDSKEKEETMQLRMQEQLEQQRRDNIQQLEQQRRDSKEKEEMMQRQMQEQLEQQKEIISLLRASKKP